jgi:hypothetical protein
MVEPAPFVPLLALNEYIFAIVKLAAAVLGAETTPDPEVVAPD